MLIIKDIPNLHLYLKAYKEKGYATGYVPTMGALHDGHGSLRERSAPPGAGLPDAAPDP